ncbi:hypothetical protein EC968_008792, partial [Mortierella alpina]
DDSGGTLPFTDGTSETIPVPAPAPPGVTANIELRNHRHSHLHDRHHRHHRHHHYHRRSCRREAEFASHKLIHAISEMETTLAQIRQHTAGMSPDIKLLEADLGGALAKMKKTLGDFDLKQCRTSKRSQCERERDAARARATKFFKALRTKIKE